MSVSQLLAGLTAKLAGLGMAAKTALGLGVAAASVTTAAAAGVLPDPAQHAVASVVNAMSPFDVPDDTGAQGEGSEVDEPGATTTTTVGSTTTTVSGGSGGGGTGGAGGGDPAAPANHGACVSEAAKAAPRGPGGVHGKAVSEVARSDCGKGNGTPTTVTTRATTTTAVDGSASANSGPGGGNGKGHGRGPGQSKRSK